MDRRLDSLAPIFKPLVFELLARFTEAQIPVLVLNTRRTEEEQAEAIRTGHSDVAHSKHQDGLAIDVCPYEVYALHGPDKLEWDTKDPIWLKLGAIGESIGLRWGGRFHPVNELGIGWDPGHFEYVTPSVAHVTPV